MIESRAVTIIPEDSETSYHSINDLGLYIGNYDCIGAPRVETHFVEVPGRNSVLDLSEAITGRPVYIDRNIEIQFGSLKEPSEWPSQISQIYNLFHGKRCKLIFDDDPEWYYIGRVTMEEFAFFRQFGAFKFTIPKADPFKYAHDIVPGLADLNISFYTSSRVIETPVTGMPVNPTFVISDLATLGTSGHVEIELYEGESYQSRTRLQRRIVTANGTYTFSNIWIEPGQWLIIDIYGNGSSGTGKASVVYRQVSL